VCFEFRLDCLQAPLVRSTLRATIGQRPVAAPRALAAGLFLSGSFFNLLDWHSHSRPTSIRHSHRGTDEQPDQSRLVIDQERFSPPGTRRLRREPLSMQKPYFSAHLRCPGTLRWSGFQRHPALSGASAAPTGGTPGTASKVPPGRLLLPGGLGTHRLASPSRFLCRPQNPPARLLLPGAMRHQVVDARYNIPMPLTASLSRVCPIAAASALSPAVLAGRPAWSMDRRRSVVSRIPRRPATGAAWIRKGRGAPHPIFSWPLTRSQQNAQ
jgi:hypothetical protein